MSAHSRIGASSMHRWAACPGSVALSKDMPNISSKYAEEGTMAHNLAEQLLTKKGMVPLNAFEEEMVEAVMVYVNAFEEASKAATFVKIEERFDLSELHPGLFGTSDGIIYHESTKTLQVWDYKHGQGIAVEVEDNEQLKYYALGALMKMKVPCSHVEMVVCQPRCFHPDGPIRKHKISVVELLDFSSDLVDAAKRTEDPKAPLASGDHCRFCPASATCPKLHETALSAAQEEFSPAFSYDPEKLADVLSKIPAIEAWAKSVKEFAYREAQAGRVPPGHKLVPRRANRKWASPEAAENFMLLELGLSYMDVHQEPKLKSPAQIETLLTKEDKKRLETIVVKESSGETLAPISDKRKATKPAVETEFSIIEGEDNA